MTANVTTPTYSVVIPFYNEAGSLEALLLELRATMEALGQPYDVILVDDGSADSTAERLFTIAGQWPACRVLASPTNEGQAAALWRGFAAARGPWIITMDGDGQNAPSDIPALIALTARCDMAVGIRTARQDSWLRRAMSRLANVVRGQMLGDRMHDSGCALKVFRREVAGAFWPIRSLYSFMPAFAVAAGYRVAEMPVRHRARKAGVSSYGLRAFAWKPLFDLLALWWLLRRRIPRK